MEKDKKGLGCLLDGHPDCRFIVGSNCATGPGNVYFQGKMGSSLSGLWTDQEYPVDFTGEMVRSMGNASFWLRMAGVFCDFLRGQVCYTEKGVLVEGVIGATGSRHADSLYMGGLL